MHHVHSCSSCVVVFILLWRALIGEPLFGCGFLQFSGFGVAWSCLGLHDVVWCCLRLFGGCSGFLGKAWACLDLSGLGVCLGLGLGFVWGWVWGLSLVGFGVCLGLGLGLVGGFRLEGFANGAGLR